VSIIQIISIVGISIELRRFHLRVISSFLINVAAGLALIIFTIHDIIVLIITLCLAILCILFLMMIERVLDEI